MKGFATVDYLDARERIRDGDILLFRGKRWFSRLIQWWTRSDYSHCGIAHWIDSGGVSRLMVIEALEGVGIVINPLRAYVVDGEEVDWFSVRDPNVKRELVVAWGMVQLGRPYSSWRQFVRSFVVSRFRWLQWIYDRLHVPTVVNPNMRFCAWVVCSALKHGEWTPDPDDDPKYPERVSPGDVAQFTCLQREGRLTWAADEPRRPSAFLLALVSGMGRFF